MKTDVRDGDGSEGTYWFPSHLSLATGVYFLDEKILPQTWINGNYGESQTFAALQNIYNHAVGIPEFGNTFDGCHRANTETVGIIIKNNNIRVVLPHADSRIVAHILFAYSPSLSPLSIVMLSLSDGYAYKYAYIYTHTQIFSALFLQRIPRQNRRLSRGFASCFAMISPPP